MLSNVSRNENLAANNNFSQLNNNSPAKKVVLCNKGEAGYFAQMDLDDDGVLTLEEFNEYCAKNGVSEEDKMKLLSAMQAARANEKMLKETQSKKEDKEMQANKEDERIYAKRGEEKYSEKMDENKDSKITYEEYVKYCEKHLENKEIKDSTSQAHKKEEIDEPEISVDVEV